MCSFLEFLDGQEVHVRKHLVALHSGRLTPPVHDLLFPLLHGSLAFSLILTDFLLALDVGLVSLVDDQLVTLALSCFADLATGVGLDSLG